MLVGAVEGRSRVGNGEAGVLLLDERTGRGGDSNA